MLNRKWGDVLIQLPTKSSGIDNRFCSQTFGMLGAPGIGKSEFWAQQEDALFLDCEGGLNFLDVMSVPIRSMQDLRETFGALLAVRDKFPYKLVVIDTLDRVVNYLDEDILSWARQKFTKNADNIISIRDVAEGGGWDLRRERLMKMLYQFQALPCAVAYISHSEAKREQDPNGKEVVRNTISISGKLGGDVMGWTNHIMHIQNSYMGDKSIRRVRTIPTASLEAKSRGGRIPDGLLWGTNPKENYDAFRKLFD